MGKALDGWPPVIRLKGKEFLNMKSNKTPCKDPSQVSSLVSIPTATQTRDRITFLIETFHEDR